MSRTWGKTYLRLIILLVIIAGVFSGFLLVRNTQLISSLALTPAPVGNVNVTSEGPISDISKVTLAFKTGTGEGQSEAVSTIAFRLNVTSKSGRKLSLVDKDGHSTKSVTAGEKINEENNWQVPVDTSSNQAGGFYVDFMSVNTGKDGYDSVDPETLVTFYVKGVSDKSDLNFSFDKDYSVMYSKRRPVTNIWSK